MKKKKCRICKAEFEPFNSIQAWCSPKCGYELSQKKLEVKSKRAEQDFRKETRKRKEALKSKSDWLKKAQAVCNAYIRELDTSGVCMSCQKPPKKRNAGHYKSVGAHPELRFHPFNIHLQCEHCNTYKSGNQVEYRIHLARKIGIKNVEWLEGPHEAQHWTIDDIKEIKRHYKDLLRQLRTKQ